jgi:hypothetical protein
MFLRVSVKKVNILSVELDEPLDEAGFRHVATSVGLRLRAQRIGASVYQAEAGLPIWPYHYHHGIEEWLPERDLSTTYMGARSGCWSWPERPPCATRKVRIISRPAILCASRKARPVLTAC